jgi:hypothetical protein
MPEELRRYRAEEWAELVEPMPGWWAADGYTEASWVQFKARRLWMRARAAWDREHPPENRR